MADSEKSNAAMHYVKYKKLGDVIEKVWECGMCKKEFPHLYKLQRHLLSHTDERNFSCHLCCKSFRQLATLNQHLTIHSTDRPHACEVCNKSYSRVSTLISHRKTHYSTKIFKCHLCPKSFHQKGNLRHHLFAHSNERPYICPHCDNGFNQKSNLVCHIKKSHPLHFQNLPLTVKKIDVPNTVDIGKNENYNDTFVGDIDFEINNGIMIDPTDISKVYKDGIVNLVLLKCDEKRSAIVKIIKIVGSKTTYMMLPARHDDLVMNGRIDQKNIHKDSHCEETFYFNISVVAILTVNMSSKGIVLQSDGNIIPLETEEAANQLYT